MRYRQPIIQQGLTRTEAEETRTRYLRINPGAWVDAEVSGTGFVSFGAGQALLDDGLPVTHCLPPLRCGPDVANAFTVSSMGVL